MTSYAVCNGYKLNEYIYDSNIDSISLTRSDLFTMLLFIVGAGACAAAAATKAIDKLQHPAINDYVKKKTLLFL